MLASALEKRKMTSVNGDKVTEQCEIERKQKRQMHRYQWRYPCDVDADLATRRRRRLALSSIEGGESIGNIQPMYIDIYGRLSQRRLLSCTSSFDAL